MPAASSRVDPLEPLAQQGPDDGPSRNPEGWSADGDAPASKRPKRFIPFSFGARDCVGRSLATINYKMLLAVLLGNFRFRLAEEVPACRDLWEGLCLFESVKERIALTCSCSLLCHARAMPGTCSAVAGGKSGCTRRAQVHVPVKPCHLQCGW